jgi:hypothetical protein
MKATLFSISEKSVIHTTHEGNIVFPNTQITVEGYGHSSIAAGILRMLQYDQCSECGKFNGLHGEVFHSSGSDGTGEVSGHYQMCSRGYK